MMQRPDTHARCRVVRGPLAVAAAVVLGTLGVSGCDSVPDYANPVEWYNSVVDAIDGEDSAAPAAPAPEVQIGAGTPPPDIIAAPGAAAPGAAAPGVGPGVPPAQVRPFELSPEIATAPAPPPGTALGAGGAFPDLASVPGADQSFPSLSSVPDAPSRQARQTELATVAEGLVADREQARYTSEVFRRERAGEQTPPPPPPTRPTPAPAPALALAAAAPVVQPLTPPTISVSAPPGAPVDVIDIFGRNYSASGPYAVAPLAPDTQVAATSALPSLAQLGISGPISAREPPGPDRLAALGTTAVVSNSAVLRFGVGSAAISAKGRKSLRALAGAHRQRGGIVRVVGHASSRTRELPMDRHNLVNFEISLARAQAVVDQLMRFGVAPASVFVSAKSDSEPIYYEWMPSGEAGNRRVEVFIDF